MKQLQNYTVFDIETTGFSGTKDKITELGAIKVREGKIIATFNALLDWKIPIPKHITEITHIDNALIDAEGINPDFAIEEFVHFLSLDTIIGHNVLKFDIPFILGNFPGLHLLNFDSRTIDTAALYKAKKLNLELVSVQDMKDILGKVYYGVKYSVDTACIEFNIDKTKVSQHRALGDCVLTKQIYENLTAIN